MNPSRALRQVDRDAQQAGVDAARERTQARSPELRLLQQHEDLKGHDDLKRLRRLDPRQHLFGCRCLLCDKRERACPVCGELQTGAINLANHLERHSNKAKRAVLESERARRRAMQPQGLQFLAALLGDPARAQHLDLRDLRAFEERLLAASGRKRRKARMSTVRSMLTEIEKDANASATLTTEVGSDVAAVVYRIALVAGVSPRAVVAALLVWGVEKFAADARAARAATAPHVPAAVKDPKNHEKRGIFPTAEAV